MPGYQDDAYLDVKIASQRGHIEDFLYGGHISDDIYNKPTFQEFLQLPDDVQSRIVQILACRDVYDPQHPVVEFSGDHTGHTYAFNPDIFFEDVNRILDTYTEALIDRVSPENKRRLKTMIREYVQTGSMAPDAEILALTVIKVAQGEKEPGMLQRTEQAIKALYDENKHEPMTEAVLDEKMKAFLLSGINTKLPIALPVRQAVEPEPAFAPPQNLPKVSSAATRMPRRG